MVLSHTVHFCRLKNAKHLSESPVTTIAISPRVDSPVSAHFNKAQDIDTDWNVGTIVVGTGRQFCRMVNFMVLALLAILRATFGSWIGIRSNYHGNTQTCRETSPGLTFA